jgi:hypothetical protein
LSTVNILLDVVTFAVLSTSILAIGTLIESKLNIANGLGAIFFLAFIQVIVSYVALNPSSSKGIWTVIVLTLYASACIIAAYSILKTITSKNRIKHSAALNLLLSLSLFNSLPGERSWDGAGYHNPISLLTFQQGSLWDWPNLIWAQWFPSGQETLSASFLPLFSGVNGLVITNYLWVAVFINLLHQLFSKYWSSFKSFWAAVMLFLTFPVFFAQLGTTYVDIPVAILVATIIYVISNYSGHKHHSIYLLMACSALAATKWNAIPLIIVVAIFGLIRTPDVLKTKIHLIFSMGLGSVMGILPFVLRNVISVGNPTFPVSGPFGFWKGYFSQSELTSVVDNANLPELLHGESFLIASLIEYLVSPFIYIFMLFKAGITGEFGSDVQSNLANYLSYDARLGGFGIPLLLLIIYSFTLRSNTFRVVLSKSILMLPLVLFPANWWPRYFIGLPIAFVLLEFNGIMTKLQSKKLLRKTVIAFCTFIAIMNLFSNIGFKQVQKSNWAAPTGYGDKIAKAIGNECSDVIVIGSGLTFSGGLWGDRGCNTVLATYGVGTNPISLGQYGILPIFNPTELLQTLRNSLPLPSLDRTLIFLLTGDDLSEEEWVREVDSLVQANYQTVYKLETSESNGHEVMILIVSK